MHVENADSAVFRKYADRIARALNRQLDTQEDYIELFYGIPELTRSFRRALDVAKMGRWFSWNGCAQQQLPEFYIQKMLLEHHLQPCGPCSSAGSDESGKAGLCDPDDCNTAFDDLEGAANAKTPQAQLAAVKAVNGGFRLAYQLMSSDLYLYSKVLYVVLRPLWSWYADQVGSVKAPVDGIQELLCLDEGKWMSDNPSLSDLVTNALHSAESLSYMEVGLGNSVLSDRIVSVTSLLLGQRAWSMAARHSVPPQSYVGLLSPQPSRQRRAMRLMKEDWDTLLLLENRRLSCSSAMRLWKDISFVRIQPLRVLWSLCEAHKGDVERAAPVQRLLRGPLRKKTLAPPHATFSDLHYPCSHPFSP